MSTNNLTQQAIENATENCTALTAQAKPCKRRARWAVFVQGSMMDRVCHQHKQQILDIENSLSDAGIKPIRATFIQIE